MNLHTETIEVKQKVLIVSEVHYAFIPLLQSELERNGAEIYFSSKLPKIVRGFDYCFFINQKQAAYKTVNDHKIKTIAIYINKRNDLHTYIHQYPNIKIIEVKGNDIRKEHLDTIFWFAFSQSKERSLKITVPQLQTKHKPAPFRQWNIHRILTKNNIVFIGVLFVVLLHTAFLVPLLFSFFSTYFSLKSLKSYRIQQVQNISGFTSTSLQVTKNLYKYSRPTFLLFSVALPFDTAIDITDKSNLIIQQVLLMNENTQQIQKLLFKKDKTNEEKSYLLLRIDQLKKETQQMEDNITVLIQKIPLNFSSTRRVQKQLIEVVESLQIVKKFFPHLDSILAVNDEKKYLLFFANNMELRPGGGFLGSFGILKVKDYTIQDIEIHDVYDADGQLIAHIDPPEPIRKYLQMPHGFLRDSNFSPDFPENYEKAKMFLEKEINLKDFSGSILITTTAIENLLEAFGDIRLPDFNETINRKNFYLKAQIHTEKGFFPGSIQKKSFLGTLARHILINLETASPEKMAIALKKSLNEKQMVVFFEDENLQKTIDPFYWSGRTIQSKCALDSSSGCIADYLYPYDANLGVNKVNFFVNRSMYLKTNINKNGKVQHTLSIQFRNESPADMFPGGIYKNYFQVMVPVNSTIQSVTKDGVMVEDYTEQNNRFKTIGLFFELPPKKNTEIKLIYALDTALKKGKMLYQLVIQKQIGSPNTDYVLQVDLPSNVGILNQNLTPLAKDNRIVYNTNLSADKIFFIELQKD